MSASVVYNDVKAILNPYIAPSVDHSTRERITLLVMGIIHGHTAAPAQIAKALSTLGLFDAKTESIERRVRRLDNDEGVSAAFCLHPMARCHLAMGAAEHIFISLDPTTKEDQIVMLAANIWYRGRSLPLAWAVWPGNTPLIGDRFWKRVSSLLDVIAPLLPKTAEVIWLADRAFGSPAFTDLLEERGWHYIVRVQDKTRYRVRRAVAQCARKERAPHENEHKNGPESKHKSEDASAGASDEVKDRPPVAHRDVPTVHWTRDGCDGPMVCVKEGSVRSLAAHRGKRATVRGQVFKKAGWREMAVVVHWGKRHKGPMCIVSDLKACYTLLEWYKRRYSIEGSFRDYKSFGWHWEQGQVKILEHIERLLVGMALASWVTLMVGASVADEVLRRLRDKPRQSRPWEGKNSLFSLGLQRLNEWIGAQETPAFPEQLTYWEAPGWRTQLDGVLRLSKVHGRHPGINGHAA